MSLQSKAVSQIDYKNPSVAVHGHYKFQRVSPHSSGGTAPTLSFTTPTYVDIEIPSTCWNPSQSTISFDMLFPAPANYTSVWTTGMSCFDSVVLTSSNGQRIVAIDSGFNNYAFCTALVATTMDEWANLDVQGNSAQTVITNKASFCGVQGSGSGVLAPDVYLTSPTGPQAMAVRWIIPLERFKHTFLAYNKDFFTSKSMNLRLGFAPADRFQLDSTTNVLGTPIRSATICTISNLYLNLSVQQDPSVCEFLKSRVISGGLHTKIPFVVGSKQNLTASTDQTQTIRLGRNSGSRLLRVYTSWMNNAETLSTAYTVVPTTSDTVGLLSCRSYVNNKPLQDERLTFISNQPYMYHKPLLKGTPMFDSGILDAYRTHVDNFTGHAPKDGHLDFTTVDGESLDGDVIYTMNTSTSNIQYNQYVWAVCQKDLVSTAEGIQLM